MRRIHEETLAKAEQVELRRWACGLWELHAAGKGKRPAGNRG